MLTALRRPGTELTARGRRRAAAVGHAGCGGGRWYGLRMAETLWRAHPSPWSHAGRLFLAIALALALAAGWWWLPLLAVRFAVPGGASAVAPVAHWLPLAPAAPALYLAKLWLRARFVRYELTSERLMITRGWLMARVDNLELYRVREMHIDLPLLPRLCGVGTIVLETVDHVEPEVVLSGVRDPRALFERLRDQVEACRRRAGIAGLS